MKYVLSIFLFASLYFFPTKTENAVTSPTIQVALLLDTSGSMSGLINQAKSQLWNILNTLSDSHKNGENSTIEMALYQYGTNTDSRSGYIRQVVPFTDNVDKLSESLFALQINGSQEYCGEVIYQSLRDLEWNESSALKTIFIAGNESFLQGPTNPIIAINKAMKQEVVINTIFCGNSVNGIDSGWDLQSKYDHGSYNFISQDEATVFVETPYDERITEMNKELNNTYVAINKKGVIAKDNMQKQDENASKYGSSNVAMRSVYKSKSNYNNASWDLVDAYNNDKAIISRVDNSQGKLKGMSKNEVQQYAEELLQKRKEIQSEIQALSDARESYIQKTAKESSNGFQSAIEKSVGKLLVERGFQTKTNRFTDSSLYKDTEQIDYKGFMGLTNEVSKYRELRLIDWSTFHAFSKDENTIILDTRSAEAFGSSHLEGAIHLNFSDFTESKLKKIIPNKNTRILIYCNNNFTRGVPAMALKSAPLALNIPTFINLYGYGYKNIYELKSEIGKNEVKIMKLGER